MLKVVFFLQIVIQFKGNILKPPPKKLLFTPNFLPPTFYPQKDFRYPQKYFFTTPKNTSKLPPKILLIYPQKYFSIPPKILFAYFLVPPKILFVCFLVPPKKLVKYFLVPPKILFISQKKIFL